MKSKSQVEIGARYWWQPRHGCTPELVEVIGFMPKSITKIKCKNVTPDRDYIVTVGTPTGQKSYVSDRPKGSKYGVNLCKGDVYDDVHICHLTATKPEVIRQDKAKGVRNSTQKTNFAA